MDRKEGFVFFGSLAVLFIVFLALMLWAESVKCSRQWDGSGMESDFAVLQGCRVQLPDGRWIPAKNYREL